MNNHGKVWALIPIKDFIEAKSRLRTVLQAEECAALARCMARDVANAVMASGAVHGTTLLGRGAAIGNLASELSCDYLEENSAADLSRNLDTAGMDSDLFDAVVKLGALGPIAAAT